LGCETRCFVNSAEKPFRGFSFFDEHFERFKKLNAAGRKISIRYKHRNVILIIFRTRRIYKAEIDRFSSIPLRIFNFLGERQLAFLFVKLFRFVFRVTN